MVTVVQLVRASDCGSECRGFESHRSPFFNSLTTLCCEGFFLSIYPLPPLTPCCPPAQPQCDKAPVAVHSRPAPFLVPRPCCHRCASRTVALDRKSAARPRAPIPVAAKTIGWGSDAPVPMRFSKRLSGVVEMYISSRAGARAHTAFFVFCLHPSPSCVRRSKSNRCGEGKGEGLCSPLPSPLCGSRLDCCGFWHEGWHVFDQSPLLFRVFVRYFPSASSEER